ncbi:hypothetical protein McanMca71_007526 [Microsporum canis]|uniref:MFS gliotoxin efflux transporter GliA n=1 Tax=Arthroderma otae (strain ATCC MYA-4605 / CBS 113480) TaxID=554155 RepID=C5FGD3_ARTOC|nr:MFS gliotoxin efflux transporter GliA [Microsporum canis CBS 113480]EEQ29818.1 MFS gliotoxin efflux transporter GliA [Microsporum canis CBS 113480]
MCEPEKTGPKWPEELAETSIAAELAPKRDRMRFILLVVVLFVSIFLTFLEPAIVATLVSHISIEFQDTKHSGWYDSVYILTFASLQPSWGKIYRYFFLKPAFLVSLLILGLGSIICGTASNSTIFIAGRAISGIAGGGITTGAYSIIGHSIKNERGRPFYVGILGAAYGMSNIVGAYIGKVFLGPASWRWTFSANITIGSLCFIAMMFSFKTVPTVNLPSTSRSEKLLLLDLPGLVTVWPAMTCYILSMRLRTSNAPWGSASATVTHLAFGVLLAIFFLAEWWSGTYANIRLRLFAARDTASCTAFAFFLAGTFSMHLYNLPVYFQSIGEVSISDSKIRIIPFMIGISSASIISGYLIRRFGYYTPMMVFGTSLTIIGSGLIYTLDAASTNYQWAAYQIITGIGIGAAHQVPIIVNMTSVKSEDISTITASTLFLQSLGVFLFNQVSDVTFMGTLLRKIATTNPELNITTVLQTQAANLRDEFTGVNLASVLTGYKSGIRGVSIVGIIVAGITLILSICPQWRKLGETS